MGPYLTTADEVPRYEDIDLELTVTGEPRQKANTRDLIVGVPEMKPVDAMTVRPGGRPVALYVSGSPFGSLPASCKLAGCPTIEFCVPGFTSAGGALLNPHTSFERGPSSGPATYALTAKQYCWPATAVVNDHVVVGPTSMCCVYAPACVPTCTM